MRYAAVFGAIAAIVIGLHLPYLELPFHWDELGQFVPAALDLYRDGSWVTHSTAPNIHPPGVMALLALVWQVTGYSILSSRLTMLIVGAAGAFLSYLLALRLTDRISTAAFAGALLVGAPMFYTQSMMVLLDMPAMTLTVLALLLFLAGRYLACAAVCVVLVLVKETAVTAPMVFGAWLLFKDRRWREALYFFAPAVALILWLFYLKQVTGSWFGNTEFARYNVSDSIMPLHIGYAVLRRVYTLFFADGHWIGAIALFLGWRALRSRDWKIAGAVAFAQIVPITVFGGAVLDRYLLPVLPVLYAAFAACIAALVPRWRIAATAALPALLVIGWFVNPPYPFPLENNLAVIDFVELQRSAARFAESELSDRRVVSVWPFSAALRDPDFGYVGRRVRTVRAQGLQAADFRKLSLEASDVIAIYSRGQTPPAWILERPAVRARFEPFVDLHPEADAAEMQVLGYRPLKRWERDGQWFAMYSRFPPE